jgi:hypothetical protein
MFVLILCSGYQAEAVREGERGSVMERERETGRDGR